MAAQNTPKRVTLQAPSGARVTVSADAADRYVKRGYERPAKKAAPRRSSKSGEQKQ